MSRATDYCDRQGYGCNAVNPQRGIARKVAMEAYEAGATEQRDIDKEAYDNLHMTYLSQVSLYRSLYDEERKKNEELIRSMKDTK